MHVQLHQPAIVSAAADVRILTNEIKAAIKAGEDCRRRGVENFHQAGLVLLKVKEQLGHGKWLTWVKETLGPKERMAQRCMKLAKCDIVSDLEEEWRRICGKADEVEDDPEADGDEDEAAPPAPTDSSIPDRLRPIFESIPLCQKVERLSRRLAKLLQEVEQTPAYLKGVEQKEHRREYSTSVRAAGRAVSALMPMRPCPDCGGAHEPSPDNDPCTACGGRGYLTAEEVTE
jgi:hypothetical protein